MLYILGSHFSSIRERGDLDPEAEAVMALRELESYMALDLLRAAAWSARRGGVTVRMPFDPRQFLFDFLPFKERSLQHDGRCLFHIRCWSDELR